MHDRQNWNQGFQSNAASLDYITNAVDNYRHTYIQNPQKRKKYIVLDFGVPVSTKAINAHAGESDLLKMHVSQWKGTDSTLTANRVMENPVVHEVTWTIARTDIPPVHLGEIVQTKTSNISTAMQLLNGMSIGN